MVQPQHGRERGKGGEYGPEEARDRHGRASSGRRRRRRAAHAPRCERSPALRGPAGGGTTHARAAQRGGGTAWRHGTAPSAARRRARRHRAQARRLRGARTQQARRPLQRNHSHVMGSAVKPRPVAGGGWTRKISLPARWLGRELFCEKLSWSEQTEHGYSRATRAGLLQPARRCGADAAHTTTGIRPALPTRRLRAAACSSAPRRQMPPCKPHHHGASGTAPTRVPETHQERVYRVHLEGGCPRAEHAGVAHSPAAPRRLARRGGGGARGKGGSTPRAWPRAAQAA